MSKFNFNELGERIKNDGCEQFKDKITSKIKQKYPELTGYEVTCDPKTMKIIITGLTDDQINQIV